MEEVVSSNLTRSTKRFQTLTVLRWAQTSTPESNWSPKMDARALIAEGATLFTNTRRSERGQPAHPIICPCVVFPEQNELRLRAQ
jgi:hypothetical protein